MANFANLTAQLNLNIQNFAQNMQRASAMANKFAANMQGQINAGMVDPAKKSKFEFKDVARIVQGIIISKVFYSSLNAIRRATDAVWEFSKQLEYAQMVYTNLFGSSTLATEFINVLKDFAAVTPFTFKQSEEAAKRLLAYGIEYKNVMYVMRGVLAAATIQGNDAVIESISRALGQIYTKGRLMNEEMRQLAEAGIPVYEILQEKLGLTSEQLRNLGRTAVPASVAINALIEGINERFSTTLQYSSMTTQGIISNIKDNATMLFAGIFSPLTAKIRETLGVFGTFIAELRDLYELRGIGGVFERLIPPELQQDVRMLIANFRLLWQVIKSNLGSILTVLKTLLVGIVKAFNAIAPAVLTVLGVFAAMNKAIVSNTKFMKGLTVVIMAAAAAWLVYKAQALLSVATAGFIKIIIAAVRGLVIALNFLVAHPVWALLALGVGIFVALSGASEKFRNSINNLFKGLYSLGGIDTSKQLLPESKERANDLSKFNKALDGTKKGMDELASATGKATKAAKSLLGFDEVFSLKSPDEGNAAGQWEEFMDSLDGAGLDLSDMQIEFPNVGEIASGFVDNLIGALGGQDKLLGAGIGALLGAALGTIFGNTKIGALIGAIAGWFWDDLAKQLGLTDVGTVALPISTALGAAIGFIAGGPLGAVVGAAIGALVGWIIDSISRGIGEGDWSKIGLPVSIGLGAAIGLIAGGPLGALVGATIGALVGWIIDSISRGIEEGDWSKIGLPVGIGLGAAIGLIAGGPLGALVGVAIGALVGWITDMFIEGFSTGNWDVSGIALSLGTGLGAAIGMIFGGPVGAIIGAAIGALIGWLVGLISDNWGAITDWFKQAIADIGEFFVGIGKWFVQAGKDIAKFFAGIGTTMGTFLKDIGDWLAKAWTDIDTWFTDLLTAIGEFFANLWNTVSEKFQAIWDVISEKLTSAWNTVSEKFQDIWDVISEKLTSAWNTVKEFFQKIWDTITEKLSGAWASVKEFFQKIWDTITEKLTNAWNSVKGFFQKIWDTIKEKLRGAWSSVTEFFGGIYDTIRNKITDMYESVKSGISNIYQSFKDWISNMWNNVFGKFFDWIDNAIDKLRNFFGLNDRAKTTDISYANTDWPTGTVTKGHKVGGIFNREHIARFAEGNKAEAIIPLENEEAMKPFVNAVSNGLTSALMPIIANMSGGQQSQLQPLYVGTLIADERGLKELSRKMDVIQLEEKARRG